MSDLESRKRPNQWYVDGITFGPSETYSITGAGAATFAAIVGTTGAFSGAVSGTTGTFTSTVVGVAGTFSGAVSGTSGTFTAAVSGTTITGTGLGQFVDLTLTTGLIVRSGTPQTLTGAGAVNITSWMTWIATTGTDALTLVDGAEGQDKYLVMKSDVADGTLTPDNLANGSTITFDDVGDSAHLVFSDGAWIFMGGTATLA